MNTAYHEAGHAVIALKLGLTIEEMTVIRDGDVLGYVRWPDHRYKLFWGGTMKEYRNRAKSSILAALAGLAAESLFCGTDYSFEPEARHGAWSDYEKAFEYLREYLGVRGVDDAEYAQAFTLLKPKAMKLVKRHRADIDRVAHALLERKTLAGHEVQALLQKDKIAKWLARVWLIVVHALRDGYSAGEQSRPSPCWSTQRF